MGEEQNRQVANIPVPELPGIKTVECPACGELFENGKQIDICDSCDKEFGDCDGICGRPDCGNDHCQHCGNNTYTQCCPECLSPLPVELWS